MVCLLIVEVIAIGMAGFLLTGYLSNPASMASLLIAALVILILPTLLVIAMWRKSAPGPSWRLLINPEKITVFFLGQAGAIASKETYDLAKLTRVEIIETPKFAMNWDDLLGLINLLFTFYRKEAYHNKYTLDFDGSKTVLLGGDSREVRKTLETALSEFGLSYTKDKKMLPFWFCKISYKIAHKSKRV